MVMCTAKLLGWVGGGVTWESSSVDEGMQVRNDNNCFFLVLSPNLNGHLRGSTCLNPPPRFICFLYLRVNVWLLGFAPIDYHVGLVF